MLFKILHGDESNISLDVTPFHEGWCYVTHSGYFYVDLNIGTAESPNNQRIKLNAANCETLMGKSLVELQSDWSVNDETSPAYIKNRTHWVSDAYQKTLFDSQDVEFLYNADYGVSAANITFVDSLKEGAELTVMFGDTEYPVVVQSLGMNLVFGNLSIAGVGSDTGEPFVSINSTDVDWEIYAQDTANTTHRMSVFYVTQDYHKLDKAYLPDDAILPEVSSEEEGYTITVQDGKWTANRPVGMSVGLSTGGEIFNSYVGDFINEAGVYGHAEGETTKALGQASHTAGKGTIASGLGQYVFGTYNIEDTSESTVDWAPERGKRKYVHIVGNGIDDSRRSNAHTLDWNGNAWFKGNVKVGGTGQDDTNAKTLATTEDITNAHTWSMIYDSGETTAEVNSFANINVAGYQSLRIAIKCVQSTNTESTTAGAVTFTGENGTEYSFASLFGNLINATENRTSGAMARFSIVDGFIICEDASRGINADGMLSTTEGEGSWALATVGCGLIMCNSPIATMSISTTNNSATHFYGVGSRVIVWGCKA